MKILSLGMGVQSTTLYYMSSTGFLDRVDYAIFADPGAEKRQTYEHFEYLKKWQKINDGVPVIHVKKDILGDLKQWHLRRLASIPVFTGRRSGQLRRQCTREYKISVIDKEIRKLYGLKPYQRYPQTEVWLGFSIDEIARCSPSKEKWKIKRFPLIELEYNRADCMRWLEENDFKIPPKSSCVFCPYQSNHNWKMLKTFNRDEFDIAVKLDNDIRDLTKRGMKGKAYLHRQCVPLDEVNLNENQIELFDNVCDGDCGT